MQGGEKRFVKGFKDLTNHYKTLFLADTFVRRS